MNKKILTIFLVFISMFFITACGNESEDDEAEKKKEETPEIIESGDGIDNKGNIETDDSVTVTIKDLTVKVPKAYVEDGQKSETSLSYWLETEDYTSICTLTITANPWYDINTLDKYVEDEFYAYEKYDKTTEKINGKTWTKGTAAKENNTNLHVYALVNNDNYYIIKSQFVSTTNLCENGIKSIIESATFK